MSSIQGGESLFAANLASEPLPGAGRAIRGPGGTSVKVADDRTLCGLYPGATRDVCVAVRGIARTPWSGFGVQARVNVEGNSTSGYQLAVYPALGTWQLVREVWFPADHHADPLVAWEFSPHVAAVGEVNEVELRCAGHILQVVLNGHLVRTVADASFGFGFAGWSVRSLSGPAEVLLQSIGACRARLA
jgi:hypothetical protein